LHVLASNVVAAADGHGCDLRCLQIDVDRGLYVLFGSSLLLSAIAAFSVMRAYQAKLTHFLNDMAAEDFMSEVISRTSVPTVSFGTGKAD